MALLAKVLVALSLGAAVAAGQGGCMDLFQQLSTNGCLDGSPCGEPCFGILNSMDQMCTNSTMDTDKGPLVLKDKAAQLVALCGPIDDLDCQALFGRVNDLCQDNPCADQCLRMMGAMTQKCTDEMDEGSGDMLLKDMAASRFQWCTSPCSVAMRSVSDTVCTSGGSMTLCAGECREKLEFMSQNCTSEMQMVDNNPTTPMSYYANMLLSNCGSMGRKCIKINAQTAQRIHAVPCPGSMP
mmetsp:Transcript_16006/g.42095  ORF Transcript_16006/g.42095 Transcript_16006/m.42095 type:complete len:240 (-) Transcript_16006:44-763(-)